MTASGKSSERPAARRRTAIWIAIALLLLGAAALAIALLTGGQPQPGASGTETPVPTSASPTPAPPQGSATPTPAPTSEPSTPDDAIESPIDEPADVGGLEIAIGSVEAVQAEANEPGEIGGPAIRVIVEFENGTDSTVSLRDTVVTVEAGADRRPASQLNEAGGPTLPNALPAGDRAEGAYVFTLPTSERDDVRITVFTSVAAPEVIFSGAVPR